MSTPNSGGPAFPQTGFVTPHGVVSTLAEYQHDVAGMSLRDYAAIHIRASYGFQPEHSAEKLARYAIADADELIKKLRS